MSSSRNAAGRIFRSRVLTPSRGKALSGLLSGLLILLGIWIAIPVTVVSSYFPARVTSHRALWIGLLIGGAAATVIITWMVGRLARRGPQTRLWQVPPLAPGWIDRAELRQLVETLTGRGAETGAAMTALVGMGGFGKTTLATQACHTSRVKGQFGGGIVWLTVGQDVNGPQLAALINDLIANVGGGPSTFTSPEQAGHALAQLLAERAGTLVVVDDVWTSSQLAPFAGLGKSCRLLVTTRRPATFSGTAVNRIDVDVMSPAAARRLLTRELPAMASGHERDLLTLTGRWPLLLSVVNRRLADEVGRGAEIDAAAAAFAGRLRSGGPAALDIDDSGSRQTAVAGTVDYSLEIVDEADRPRFWELGIFPADAEIPLDVVTLLWRGTAGIGAAESEALCDRFAGLSLLAIAATDRARVVVIHDVIRDYALSRLRPPERVQANATLVDAARSLIESAAPSMPASSDDHGEGSATDWWRLPEEGRWDYLWQNLTYHLQEASLEAELDGLCRDLHFVAKRLLQSGPAAAEADLARSTSATAASLRRAIAQYAHLLGQMEPESALTSTLLSRLEGIDEVASQYRVVSADLHAWIWRPLWPLPDQPSGSLIRVLIGYCATVSPDGTWLATCSDDKSVRIWAADGAAPRAILTGQVAQLESVAISPDGTWLASGGVDGKVRIWTADGTLRGTLSGHTGPVYAVAISPDGAWLATGSYDHTVRTWTADGTRRGTLTGHTLLVDKVAISPDGTWLASHSYDNTVRIWAADGTLRATVFGFGGAEEMVGISPDGSWLATIGCGRMYVEFWAADGTPRGDISDRVRSAAISPDGTWLATASEDGQAVRTWTADGAPRATFSGNTGGAGTVAISPDGTWLATCHRDKTIRTWAADGAPRATFTGHSQSAFTVAISPDGTWLATGDVGGEVRIWATDGATPAALGGVKESASLLAISPDGTWLATASLGDPNGTVRTWDADGAPRIAFTGHTGNSGYGDRVTSMAISPDGTWLATANQDTKAYIWAADGTLRATLIGHTDEVTSVAISPDGAWLATTCPRDADAMVRIWTADGTPRATFSRYSVDSVGSLAISPDGTWLATGNRGGTVSIRSADDGTPRALLTGHTKLVTTLAISPDGTWLATGSDDNTARIWAADGTPRALLTGHTKPVTTVAISPDSTWLATVSDDQTIRIWSRNETAGSVTAMRVDGTIRCCAWFPDSTDLCVAGDRGLYRFALQAPGVLR